MEKLNNYLFKKQLDKYLSKHSKERRFITYEKTTSICMLFESPIISVNPELIKMIKKIKNEGKHLTAWGFIPMKKLEEHRYMEYSLFSQNEIDFFKRPKKDFFKGLYDQKFDVLIDLSVNRILPLAYLATNISADFKIGIKKEACPIYDFMLDIENIPEKNSENNSVEKFLLEQITFYLKEIQSND